MHSVGRAPRRVRVEEINRQTSILKANRPIFGRSSSIPFLPVSYAGVSRNPLPQSRRSRYHELTSVNSITKTSDVVHPPYPGLQYPINGVGVALDVGEEARVRVVMCLDFVVTNHYALHGRECLSRLETSGTARHAQCAGR